MKTWLIAIALTLTTIFGVAGSATASSSVTFLEYAQDRTVLIVRDCQDTSKNGWGTGIVWKGDKIITAAHVIDNREGCTFLIRREKNEPSYTALVIKEDSIHDLALLTVNHDYGVSTEIAESKLGEPITVIGFPVQFFDRGEQYLSITQGYITTKNVRVNGGARWVDRISALVNFGNSGGPAFNELGQVVGIVVLMHTDAQGYFYIARGSDVLRFLDGC